MARKTKKPRKKVVTVAPKNNTAPKKHPDKPRENYRVKLLHGSQYLAMLDHCIEWSHDGLTMHQYIKRYPRDQDSFWVTPYNKGYLWKIQVFNNGVHKVFYGTIYKFYASTLLSAIKGIPVPEETTVRKRRSASEISFKITELDNIALKNFQNHRIHATATGSLSGYADRMVTADYDKTIYDAQLAILKGTHSNMDAFSHIPSEGREEIFKAFRWLQMEEVL